MTDGQYISAVNSYSHTVYRIAFHYFGNRYDAEDVLQECYLKLYRHRGTFESDEDIKRWLIRVAINECHSLFRLMKRTITKVPETCERFGAEDFDDYAQRKELMDAILSLPGKYRTTIYLHYYEGYSVKEIAGMLCLSESAVSMQLLRARKRLKIILQKEPEDLL